MMDRTRARAFAPSMRNEVGTSRTTPSWDLTTERRADDGETLARGLGWFSIGLGAAELVAGGRIARGLGIPGSAGLVRAFGLREIGQGIGILHNRRRPGGWIAARIAGDALDLGVLATGLPRRKAKRRWIAAAMAAVAGAAALDVLCALQLRDQRRRPHRRPAALAAPPQATEGAAAAP